MAARGVRVARRFLRLPERSGIKAGVAAFAHKQAPGRDARALSVSYQARRNSSALAISLGPCG